MATVTTTELYDWDARLGAAIADVERLAADIHKNDCTDIAGHIEQAIAPLYNARLQVRAELRRFGLHSTDRQGPAPVAGD